MVEHLFFDTSDVADRLDPLVECAMLDQQHRMRGLSHETKPEGANAARIVAWRGNGPRDLPRYTIEYGTLHPEGHFDIHPEGSARPLPHNEIPYF